MLKLLLVLALVGTILAQEDPTERPKPRPKHGKTWDAVSKCMRPITQKCLKRFPKTPKKDSACFVDKKIKEAFRHSTKPLQQCVQKKLHTGNRCVKASRHWTDQFEETHDNNTRSGFIRCVHLASAHCTAGCETVKGRRVWSLFQCERATMGKAFKMFWTCWKKRHPHAEEIANLEEAKSAEGAEWNED